MIDQLLSHTHIVGTLFEGVTGFITVFIVIHRAGWEMQTAVFTYDCLLVLDTCVFTVKLKVYRNSGISGNLEFFNHIDTISFLCL